MCLSSKYTVVRYLSAKCFGVFSIHLRDTVLNFIIESILPKLKNTNMDVAYLQGPMETIHRM